MPNLRESAECDPSQGRTDGVASVPGVFDPGYYPVPLQGMARMVVPGTGFQPVLAGASPRPYVECASGNCSGVCRLHPARLAHFAYLDGKTAVLLLCVKQNLIN
jgi:hypothetical protein